MTLKNKKDRLKPYKLNGTLSIPYLTNQKLESTFDVTGKDNRLKGSPSKLISSVTIPHQDLHYDQGHLEHIE